MTSQNLEFNINIEEIDDVDELTLEEYKERFEQNERNGWEEVKKYLLRNNCPVDKLPDVIQKQLKL